MNSITRRLAPTLMVLVVGLALAQSAAARIDEREPEYQYMQALEKEWQVGPFAPKPGERVTRPADVPDIFGPGAVLTVGNVFMKCTNYGLDGNPFPNLSSDPSGQWPGASGVEYLSYIALAVGAVNPFATDPTAVRRVSYLEWRPPTLDPVDRMYRAYDGIVNGQRFVNDDGDTDPITGDPRIDEDRLDGHDNDGDGLIDEDYGAIGQEMFCCVIRDDTPEAINAAATERHVPLGLEAFHTNWAYSIPGYMDFDVIEYDITNVSGHELDSVYVGIRDDMDCGPISMSDYWADDFNLPQYPFGDFIIQTQSSDLRLQPANDRDTKKTPDVSPDSALCPRYHLRVQGWSCVDDNGDDGKTPGVATVMLIDHTIDPTGANGPSRVGLRAFRTFRNGTPYTSDGSPTIDQQRYEFMSSTENIDPFSGFITAVTGDQRGDYADWASIGPWLKLPAGGEVTVTLAFGVATGTLALGEKYAADYELALDHKVTQINFAGPALCCNAVTQGGTLLSKYPSLENALSAEIAFEGAYEVRNWPWLTDGYGKETGIRAAPGFGGYTVQGCPSRDPDPHIISDKYYTWFDLDCDYCTGAYSKSLGGLFHHTWLAESPPPSPNTNMDVDYDYSENPGRRFIPAGDKQVTVAWDNLSETTPDPKSGQFDFRGYKIWKVSNWQRPVGAAGPYEDDWTLLSDYRLFDAAPSNAVGLCPPESVTAGVCSSVADTLWPQIYVPSDGSYRRLKLYSGDMWNIQTGEVLRSDATVLCQGWPNCSYAEGFVLGQVSGTRVRHIKYPIGRYHVVDKNVKDGFVYFYSVTAYDSTGAGQQVSMLESKHSAVEAQEVIPQASVDTVSNGAHVWVVPNPYRGYSNISQRPSSWDLTPNATDPTGTHIDFMGLPRGAWKIKIFTVAGDLVATLNSTDAVNQSIRSPVTDPSGVTHPGYNEQADNPNDGEASWNLISRNGQDVVSGIYLFTVEVGGSVRHRGKFVIIR